MDARLKASLRRRLDELHLPAPDVDETTEAVFVALCETVAVLASKTPAVAQDRDRAMKQQIERAKGFWGFSDRWIESWILRYGQMAKRKKSEELLVWLRNGAPVEPVAVIPVSRAS